MKNGIKLVAAVLALIVLAGCTPGYVCPLRAGPGSCSSQQSAYQATLHHEADGVSIFNGTTNDEQE